MKFTRQEEIAILFVSELASSSAVVSISYMAETHGLSPLFLKKIALQLRQAGLVSSREGARGGYELCVNPSNLPVAQILRAASNDPLVHLMRSDTSPCPLRSSCLPEKVRRSIWNAMGQTFEQMTIRDLISYEQRSIS